MKEQPPQFSSNEHHSSNKHSPNEVRMIVALVIIAAFLPTVLMMAPAIASQLASEFQFGPAQIGRVISSELVGMSLATIPAWYWLHRFTKPNSARVCIVLFAVFNLISGFAQTELLFIVFRFLSGLAGGSLMIICLYAASTTRNPDRVYSFWVLGQLIVGAIGLAVLPSLFLSFGIKAAYFALAVLILGCSPLCAFFATPNQTKTATKTLKLNRMALIGLVAVLLFYVSLNGVWTFAGMFAERLNLSSTKSGEIFSVASIFGIAGALCAAWLGHRWGRFLPLFAGFSMMILGTYLLQQNSEYIFSNATFLFKFSWTLALPFILATLAKIDHQGQLMNSTNLVIGGGLAIGPAIFGHLLESGHSLDHLVIYACITALISFILLGFILSQSNTPSVQGAHNE
ncbi:MFS transporter [Vibrio penaeicida]|uniref:MFS transporter n=1 Tax=Vibrio penaeicida TaxID=104609 RepID=UPI000CEA1427|nr:MFS transporter [Vibrio penaeicida]